MKYLLFGALPFVLACEKSREWEPVSLAPPALVVEAILTDEDTVQAIRLSQSYTDLNGTPPPVDDAVVTVEANGVTYDFSADSDAPGRYRSLSSFAVVDRLEYTLNIDWKGERYAATTRLGGVAPLPEITFLPYGSTDSLQLGDFVPPFSADQQAMYEIDLDWSHLGVAPPDRAKVFLYTFRELHVGQFGLPPREVVFFPRGTYVTVTKYGLSDDFAAFLRARAIETDWNGNFFYGTSDNPPTNISNGGLGFFGACAVLRQTVVAE